MCDKDKQELTYWKQRALNADQRAEKAEQERDEYKEKCAELASELWWKEEWLANPTATDKHKANGTAIYRTLKSTKPREDGSIYFSRIKAADAVGNIRNPLAPDKPGNKEQSISDTHTQLKKSGLITSTPESQKFDKSKVNYFDTISPQWENNPRSVVLVRDDEVKKHGGKRIPLHRSCGGALLERTVFTCTKCGEDHISEKDIIRVDEEKLNSWAMDDIETQEQEPITEPIPIVQKQQVKRSIHSLQPVIVEPEPEPERLESIPSIPTWRKPVPPEMQNQLDAWKVKYAQSGVST